MKLIHTESIKGIKGEPFYVRIFDSGASKEAALNLLIMNKGEEQAINISIYQYEINVSNEQIINFIKEEIKDLSIIYPE